MKHFTIEGGVIFPQTAEARVTVNIFRMNDEDRVQERRRLLEAGLLLDKQF